MDHRLSDLRNKDALGRSRRLPRRIRHSEGRASQMLRICGRNGVRKNSLTLPSSRSRGRFGPPCRLSVRTGGEQQGVLYHAAEQQYRRSRSAGYASCGPYSSGQTLPRPEHRTARCFRPADRRPTDGFLFQAVDRSMRPDGRSGGTRIHGNPGSSRRNGTVAGKFRR